MKTNKTTMHPPYAKFKGFAREMGITYADIAKLLNLTVSTVSMKINGYSDFYLGEIRMLRNEYNLPKDIFD